MKSELLNYQKTNTLDLEPVLLLYNSCKNFNFEFIMLLYIFCLYIFTLYVYFLRLRVTQNTL